ncbi:MAG: hypothetical protein JO257_16755 [Deltaproteobacteria bacterium]|nr:hypothetical protein [Deltaproteobacteria bacterium]
MKTWTRAIALTLAISLAATSCGYILYPERRGQSGGTIDGGTLVMDLLWLLPGIVPGVVFLIVDFTSGAMYVNGRVAMRADGNHNLAIALKDSPTPRSLDLSVVTKSHKVLDHKLAAVGPAIHGQVVQLHVADTHEAIFLRIDDHEHPAMQLPIDVL